MDSGPEMCLAEKPSCSVQQRCGTCEVCRGQVPPCQLGLTDVCCGCGGRIRVHKLTDLNEAVTDEGGGVAVPPEGEVGTRGGGEKWGHTH